MTLTDYVFHFAGLFSVSLFQKAIERSHIKVGLDIHKANIQGSSFCFIISLNDPVRQGLCSDNKFLSQGFGRVFPLLDT